MDDRTPQADQDFWDGRRAARIQGPPPMARSQPTPPRPKPHCGKPIPIPYGLGVVLLALAIEKRRLPC